MNKLTAEKCSELLDDLNGKYITQEESFYLQALEIALPILEDQERDDTEWIEWKGGEAPFSENLEVKFRNGMVFRSRSYKTSWERTMDFIKSGLDTVAYRRPKTISSQNFEASDERWRLTNESGKEVEWTGRLDEKSLPEMAKEALLMHWDYDAAKSGAVRWHHHGHWKFEQVLPERATNQNGEQ